MSGGIKTRSVRLERGLRAARRGVALLEVVVSLGILLLAMAVVGATFRNSDFHVHRAVDMSRAMLLTEQIITNYDTGQYQAQQGEENLESTGTFSDGGPPGWGWGFK